MKKAIRNDEDARAYLAENHPSALERIQEHKTLGLVIVTPAPCGRCGGSGHGHWYQDGGICYECRGHDTRNRKRTSTLKSYAQAAKRRDTAAEKKVSARRAEREARRQAGLEFVASVEGLGVALKGEHRILADLAEKVDLYGSLSDKQVALAFKIAGELENRVEVAKVTPAAGRTEIAGLVISEKESFGPYGSSIRITVKVEENGGEWLANGTAPASLLDATAGSTLKGREVRFSATVEPRDEGFAFFKRPTKAELIDDESTVESDSVPCEDCGTTSRPIEVIDGGMRGAVELCERCADREGFLGRAS